MNTTYQIMNGRENAVTGNQLYGVPAAINEVVWLTYNNGYPAGDGYDIRGGGSLRW